ncbi:MAG: DUF4388 domain-containing protein [Lentisphaeria bacterium]
MPTHLLVIDPDPRRREETVTLLQSPETEAQGVATFAEAHPLLEAPTPPEPVVLGVTAAGLSEAAAFCAQSSTGASPRTVLAYLPGDDEAGRLRLLENGAETAVTGAAWMTELRAAVLGGGTAGAAPAEQQMFFKLKTGELGNVLQFLNFSGRNGRLDITFPGNRDAGHLFISQGEVIQAEYAGLGALEAIAQMLGQGDAEGQFFETTALPAPELLLPLSQLMIEATVLADENREARQAIPDANAIPRRLAADCPADSGPDEQAAWAEMDGATAAGILLAEAGLSPLRGWRALNKLLAAGAIAVLPADSPDISAEARLDSLLRRVRRRIAGAPDNEQRQQRLAHLETLAGLQPPDPGDYLGTTLIHFPDSVSVQFATCLCGCGNQLLMIEGSPVVCARCGTPLWPRNRALYRLA